jgi:L,D-peptidoglycan transpeptidase YkuD (ErfK/YbiS/YcfS/YnhG family)
MNILTMLQIHYKVTIILGLPKRRRLRGDGGANFYHMAGK